MKKGNLDTERQTEKEDVNMKNWRDESMSQGMTKIASKPLGLSASFQREL